MFTPSHATSIIPGKRTTGGVMWNKVEYTPIIRVLRGNHKQGKIKKPEVYGHDNFWSLLRSPNATHETIDNYRRYYLIGRIAREFTALR